jgi:hypothetical protein
MKLYIDSVVMGIDDMTDKSDKDRAKLARDSFVGSYGEFLKPYDLKFNNEGAPTIDVNSVKDMLDISKIISNGIVISDNTITIYDDVMF